MEVGVEKPEEDPGDLFRDFPDDDSVWQWQIIPENPEYFRSAAIDEWGFVSLTNAEGQSLYSCLTVQDSDVIVNSKFKPPPHSGKNALVLTHKKSAKLFKITSLQSWQR